jgi:hypothetical protein
VSGLVFCASRTASGAPTVEQVFRYCTRMIVDAASCLWPDDDVRLIEHVPSVTGYVHRIEVAGAELYAKTSILGASLVSILRGRRGHWANVLAAQRRYVHDPDNLLRRECDQLQIMGASRWSGSVRAKYRSGVLITEPAEGRSLGEIAFAEPHRVGALLAQVWALLEVLRRNEANESLPVISERDIFHTFVRKFSGDLFGMAARLGLTECPEQVVAGLRRAADLVRRLPTPQPGTGAVYGDLKPEHVIVDDAGTMRVIDPGIMRGHPVVDAGKLVSRLLVSLFCLPPDSSRDHTMVDAIDGFVDRLARAVPTADRAAWWRDLVALWLRDTLNILSTYLAAPVDLPLPAHGTAVINHAEQVCALVETVATTLLDTDPIRAWRHGIAGVISR